MRRRMAFAQKAVNRASPFPPETGSNAAFFVLGRIPRIVSFLFMIWFLNCKVQMKKWRQV
jgi:hypothetical protein